MIREIKFRGKRIDNGEWICGSNIQFQIDGTDRVCISEHGYQQWINPETVGQFTGLHDKNGKEIYENDIVKCNDSDWTFTVVFQTAAFKLHRPDGYDFTITKDDLFEVIGNIYDDRMLLKNDASA